MLPRIGAKMGFRIHYKFSALLANQPIYCTTGSTVKVTIRKATSSGLDVDMAMLWLRTIPIDHFLPNPAELLYNQRIKGKLPFRIENRLENKEEVRRRLVERPNIQKIYRDRGARGIEPFHRRKKVRTRDPATGLWWPRVIRSTCKEPGSYIVENAERFR